MNHIDNYLVWLKTHMRQETVGNNLVEITTPFLDRHNDCTQIYVENLPGGQVRISDYGYIVDDLEMCGVSLEKGKRNTLFRQVLNGRGIRFDKKSKALYVVCDKSQMAENQHMLLQSMLDVNDMFYLSSDNVTSVFYDDVVKFFDSNDIYYSKDMKVTGRSGLTHDFPFVMQKNKNHPERMVKLSNRFDKNEAERFMFAWSDVYENRKDSQLIILVNDANPYNKNLPEHMARYNSSISTVNWSERMNSLKIFA